MAEIKCLEGHWVSNGKVVHYETDYILHVLLCYFVQLDCCASNKTELRFRACPAFIAYYLHGSCLLRGMCCLLEVNLRVGTLKNHLSERSNYEPIGIPTLRLNSKECMQNNCGARKGSASSSRSHCCEYKIQTHFPPPFAFFNMNAYKGVSVLNF